MVNSIVLVIMAFIIGLLIVSGIVMFFIWIKMKRIRKKAPSFEGSPQDWRQLNFDPKALERREIQYGDQEGRARDPQEETRGTGSGEEFDNDDEEIARIREEIRRRESELSRK